MDDFTKIEVDKIFPGPVPDQEGDFNAKRARRKWLDLYLDAGDDDTIKKAIQFFLLDGPILRAMKLIELDPEALELFHGTIRKQLDMDYNRIDFDKYLAGLHNYDTEDLFRMGKVFKHELRSDTLAHKLLLHLRKRF